MTGQAPELSAQWNIPQKPDEIDSIFNQKNGIYVFYKHSYRCGVCSFSKSRVESVLDHLSEKAEFYFIDVIQNRPVSDRIAQLSGIRHASPQLIIVRDGKVIKNASHGDISAELIQEKVN